MTSGFFVTNKGNWTQHKALDLAGNANLKKNNAREELIVLITTCLPKADTKRII
jgi:hypothetical protein